MSNDPVRFVANVILGMDKDSLARLRQLLEEADPGDEAGVGAIVPPNLPLKEGAAEVEIPEDYWETAQ